MSVRSLMTLPRQAGAVLGGATNPIIIGALLAYQQRNPMGFAEFLKKLCITVSTRKQSLVLRGLFLYGLLRAATTYLDVISQNAWKLRSQQESWVWSKEVAVVTGGSAGIGAEIVKELVKLGTKVAVLDVSPLSAELTQLHGVNYFQVDVTDADAITAVSKEVEQKVGRVSILVNNAGIGDGVPILEREPAYLKRIFSINIIAHWHTVQAFLPGMLERNHGHIVSIASLASFVSSQRMADYCATKAAVLSFHESLKQEIQCLHRKDGVLTTIVHPGWVKTDLTRKNEAQILKITRGRPMLSPSVIGRAVVDQLRSGRGAQLVIPETQRLLSTLKAWPHWLQEGLRTSMSRAAARKTV